MGSNGILSVIHAQVALMEREPCLGGARGA